MGTSFWRVVLRPVSGGMACYSRCGNMLRNEIRGSASASHPAWGLRVGSARMKDKSAPLGVAAKRETMTGRWWGEVPVEGEVVWQSRLGGSLAVPLWRKLLDRRGACKSGTAHQGRITSKRGGIENVRGRAGETPASLQFSLPPFPSRSPSHPHFLLIFIPCVDGTDDTGGGCGVGGVGSVRD